MKLKNRNKSEVGMTLIEILIAMVLGIFLIGGIIQIFIGSQQSYRMQENLSRMQENGRFAMEFISRDVRMADYWGCLREGLNKITNNLNTTGAGYDSTLHNFDKGIDGTNGASSTPDTITMRGIYDNGIAVQSPFGPTTSAQVNVSAGNTLTQGDVVIVADCSSADIFQISNVNPGTSGVLMHLTDAATNPGNINISDPSCPGTNTHCFSKVYQSDASVYKPTVISYSVKNGASGLPALFRNNNGVDIEFIEGIEDLQIFYGEDTNDDNTSDHYVSAQTAGLDMDRVVSVRVTILVASLDNNLSSQAIDYSYNGATITPTDRRLRQVFSSTIAVRNRLP